MDNKTITIILEELIKANEKNEESYAKICDGQLGRDRYHIASYELGRIQGANGMARKAIEYLRDK